MVSSKNTDENQTFEESIHRLEQIAMLLEKGDLDLQISLERYEEGIRLLRHCTTLLSGAKQKIELLKSIDESGMPLLEKVCLEDFQSAEEVPGRNVVSQIRHTPQESSVNKESSVNNMNFPNED